MQELRRRIYSKSKAEPQHRFWGLYVHLTKLETLAQAYALVKENKGAPGIDEIDFEDIKQYGEQKFLTEIKEQLETGTYKPSRCRSAFIPKSNGDFRELKIATIRDRTVQGAIKLVLEPIFEADFQEGSYGYRPHKNLHEASTRVAEALMKCKRIALDIDLKAFFDNVRHHTLLEKLAKRISDDKVLGLIKLILKAAGKRGIPQGFVCSPLFANVYLTEIDKMLEKARKVTTEGRYTHIEYVRVADDIVVLIDDHPRWKWLVKAAYYRLNQEFKKLGVEINVNKTKLVNLKENETLSYIGFNFKLAKGKRYWAVQTPSVKSRTKLLQKIKNIFRKWKSQPIQRVIEEINPILRGWVNYFRIGHSFKQFKYIKKWIEWKTIRHIRRNAGRRGPRRKRWSRSYHYGILKVFNNYKITYVRSKDYQMNLFGELPIIPV